MPGIGEYDAQEREQRFYIEANLPGGARNGVNRVFLLYPNEIKKKQRGRDRGKIPWEVRWENPVNVVNPVTAPPRRS